MEAKELSLHHLVQFPPLDQNQDPNYRYPTVLALHGRGSNEHDLIGLAPHFPDGLLWISPRGPHKLGTDAYEWYRVETIGKPDSQKVASALETIDHFIDGIISAWLKKQLRE